MGCEEFWEALGNGLKGDYYESNSKKDYPEYGDIIAVDRTLYYHYGIYVNDNQIIHYAPYNGEPIIHVASLKVFLDGNVEFYICNCPKLPAFLGTIPDPIMAFLSDYKLYTPKETVNRAKGMIGDVYNKYNLLANNCEHFSYWCKTGIKESLQSFNFLKAIRFDKVKIN